jgi:formylglycine-generating enzyme required for sulfatase activity
VQTDGGTFIGRDQIIVISGYTGEQLELVLAHLREILAGGQADLCADIGQQRLTVTAPDAPRIVLSEQAARDLLPAAARQANERAYLTALLVNPRYGRWARQFVPLAGILTTTELPPGFTDVPSEFTELAVSGQGAGRQVRRIPLTDITEALARHDALALLGEPGAGKTTTLYKLALDAARRRLTSGQDQAPLLLSLADYRGYPSPQAFLQATWTHSLGRDDLTERLRRGELLLLCDALNEMPFADDRDYREKVAAWRRFAGEWPGNRLVFTCRSRDYSEPLGLPQVEIERLDDRRVQEFLAKYLASQPGLAETAWTRLAGSPLLALVRNPYYLSMLCLILAGKGAWPANRGQLFDEFAGYLLRREADRGHPDWPGLEPLRTALAGLAEAIQPLGQGTRLPRPELLKRIPSQVDGKDGPASTPPQTILRLGLAATLLDTELAPGETEMVRFYHHQLQEYFAARALLRRFVVGEDLSGRWRAPRLAREMPATGALGDYEPLPPPPAAGWEEATILAVGLAADPAALVEAVRRVNPVLAARCLAESGVAPSPALLKTVQEDLLVEMGNRQAHLRARLAAGDALAALGDLRFREIQVDGRRVLLPPLIRIPAGPVMLGSRRWQVWWLTRRGFPAEEELPRHPVQVAAFAIGQYPVTNAEYACFMAAGGYQQEGYWRTAAARAWLRGEITDSGVVGDLMNVWRALRTDPKLLKRLSWSPRDKAAWEQVLQMEEAEARAVFARQYADRPRDRPAFWADERYNGPAQPVVGVNWYEAAAYCAWLTGQMGRVPHVPGTSQVPGTSARLPTEAEWERAARMGRGWVYPWGNRWDAGRANTWEGHVLRPNPVGVYPDGATPERIHDLSGNVWEWTASLYQPYPYRADDGRNDPEADGPRVVRGGSWLGPQRAARCAVRGRDGPGYFLTLIGFRVVASL